MLIHTVRVPALLGGAKNCRKVQVFAFRLTPGPLQATLSKLLTYCVLRLTQPPTLSGTRNE